MKRQLADVPTRPFDVLRDEVEQRVHTQGVDALARHDALHEKYRLANRILEKRRQQRLSQEELARRTGMKQADVSRIERGLTDPQATTLARLARAMGQRLDLVDDPEAAEAHV